MAKTTRRGSSRTPDTNRIAKERIERLFALAEEVSGTDPTRSKRYVALARRIGMRQRVRIPADLRFRFCRRCSAYLVPGASARVRVQHGKVIVTCLVCGHQKRYPVVKKHRKE
ncbi:ribonuclease P protein component 4 [Methanofollis tationis]|uniref:Ribonuclease P n=2 Tax=cellular organisms TaxID=131567 RepID=A0A831LMK1_9BACT|nr:ribonuclease P protein component 4 [Methanofollis tationis]NVO67642.1 ribonuclease P [Methanofollis tationis]HDR46396.1 ribonuclease P [Geoalkalibacter subterraneus]